MVGRLRYGGGVPYRTAGRTGTDTNDQALHVATTMHGMHEPRRRSPLAQTALVAFAVLGTLGLILGVLYVIVMVVVFNPG